MHCALDVTTDLASVVADHGDLSCVLLGDGLCFCLVDCDGTPKATERGLMHIALPCVILTHVPLRGQTTEHDTKLDVRREFGPPGDCAIHLVVSRTPLGAC